MKKILKDIEVSLDKNEIALKEDLKILDVSESSYSNNNYLIS